MRINSIQQNFNKDNQTSFKAIKSIKCKGLYNKSPQYAQEIIETFKNNDTVMKFCKKYDVNVVLGTNSILGRTRENYLRINFINPIKSKFLGIFGSKKDSIIVGDVYTDNNFIDANKRLKNYIVEVIGKPMPELSMNVNAKESEINSGLKLDKTLADTIASTIDATK